MDFRSTLASPLLGSTGGYAMRLGSGAAVGYGGVISAGFRVDACPYEQR